MELIYEVYALLDTNRCITSIESTAFHDKEELLEKGYIKIDEGCEGDIYGHAQPNYLRTKFGESTFDEKMYCNFKLIDQTPILLSEQEKEKLFNSYEHRSSEQELINAQLMLEIAKLKVGTKNG